MITKDGILKSLHSCVDFAVYLRGERYFKEGSVIDLRITDENKDTVVIEGDVLGTELYNSYIDFSVTGGAILSMGCSCPYGDGCKHSVALALAYADTLGDDVGNVPFSEQTSHNILSPFATGLEQEATRRKKPFNPTQYFIRIDDHRLPDIYEVNNNWYGADVKKILEKYDCSTEVQEVLNSLKKQHIDMVAFCKAVATAKIPIRFGYGGAFGSSVIQYNENPELLEVSFSYRKEKTYGLDAHGLPRMIDVFALRVPVRKGGAAHDEMFYQGGSQLLRECGSVVSVFSLDERLIRLIYGAYVRKNRVVDEGGHAYFEKTLNDEDIVHFEELVSVACKQCTVTGDVPNFTTHESKQATPAFVMAYNSAISSVECIPVIDYGIHKQMITETVYTSNVGGRKRILRRDGGIEERNYIIKVENSVIHYAKSQPKLEVNFYRELTKTDNLGFTARLINRRKGKYVVARYINTIWPEIKAYAERKKYQIIFSHDTLAIETAKFRADFDVDLSAGIDLLSFDMSCYCGDDKITTATLQEYLESGDAHLRKEDGTLVHIENREDLERIMRMLRSFEERENGGFEGRIHNAPELEYLLTSSTHYNSKCTKSFETFMHDVQKGKPVEKIKIPAKLNKVLRPYQKEGVHWLHFLRSYRFAGILADDMGLGKTLQTLTLLSMTRDTKKRGKKPSLIVCPKTLLYNWAAEAEKFVPDMSVLIYDGNISERKAKRNDFKKYDMIIMGYNTAYQDTTFLEDPKTRFNYLVLDEAQNIKNHKSKRAQVAKKIHSDYRLALTGTPLENNVSEVWSMFDFLMPGFLGSYKDFSKCFHKPIMDTGDADALAHLRRKVECFMLRRTKSEVLKELPPKIEQQSTCHLGDDQNVLYQQILAKVRTDVLAAVEEKGLNRSQIHILAGLTKLRQACNHPALLTKDSDWRKTESAKLDMCIELVEEIVEGKRKVLIFSQFTSMLDIIAEVLQEKKIEHLYLSGKTKDRQSLVERFNTDESIPVFLISTKAGGTGLNLTSADSVIIFDPWWNPSVENQAVDRAHRFGQNKSVNVYRLITNGTIEEKIQKLQSKKQALADALIGESKDLFKKLSWDDIKELFA